MEPKSLIITNGCYTLRIDCYKEIHNRPTCRITCIEDNSHTINEFRDEDDDNEFIPEFEDCIAYLKAEDIDPIIEKLKEAKEYLSKN